MAEENSEYLVRGAQLVCTNGSHIRRLNLPESHGTYTKEHPFIIKEDMTGDNIKFFGVCFGENPPADSEIVRYAGGYDETGAEAEDVQGPKCCPKFTSMEWKNAYGNSVTTEGYLMCECGGKIYPLSSGIEYEDE